MNIIDEASWFHVALVLKEGEPSEFGNLTAMDYVESHKFREWCAALGIEVQMAAGEAHRQIGIVETHIRPLKSQLSLKEDELPDASIDELVEQCVAAKVRRQTFDGYSPLQW